MYVNICSRFVLTADVLIPIETFPYSNEANNGNHDLEYQCKDCAHLSHDNTCTVVSAAATFFRVSLSNGIDSPVQQIE